MTIILDYSPFYIYLKYICNFIKAILRFLGLTFIMNIYHLKYPCHLCELKHCDKLAIIIIIKIGQMGLSLILFKLSK